MSITIYISNAPTVTRTIECGCDGDVDCRDCGGSNVFEVAEAAADAEVNLCGSNAMTFLGAMGHAGEFGSIEVAQLPGAIHGLMTLINSESRRSAHLLDAEHVEASQGRMVAVRDGGVTRLCREGGSPAVHFGGRSDEYVARRANDILAVLRRAQQESAPVLWG